MTDFPRSLIEWQQRFADEAACVRYLFAARWPEGFVCPDCGESKAWELQTQAWTWECAGCGKQTSVTAGTIMHHSKLPLTTWFWSAYLMATRSNGISALQLQRQLDLGSYKTAWLLCAKLRRSMVAPGRSALAGLVEVDETEIACRSKYDPLTGGGGRSHQGKMLVVGVVEIEDGGTDPGASGSPRWPTTRPTVCIPSLPKISHRGRAPRPTDGPLIPAPRRQPRSPCHRQDGRRCRAALGASHLRQPQGLGVGRLSRPAPQPSPILSRRVRLPLQPPSHTACRLPLSSRHRRRPRIPHQPNVEFTGSKVIRLLRALKLEIRLEDAQYGGRYVVDNMGVV